MSADEVRVLSSFDDPRTADVRFMQEAARRGPLHVLLLADESTRALTGGDPRFPLAERRYFCEALRYVDRVTEVHVAVAPDALPVEHASTPATWVVRESDDTAAKRRFCEKHGMSYAVIEDAEIREIPTAGVDDEGAAGSIARKVIATGCYDWLHSGHVRFFEEASELGDLYVTVGNDVSVGLFKGPEHPHHPEDERRYMVGAIRYARKAIISTGQGWMDALPEIGRLRPDIWVVNEDGDRAEKREFCEAHAIEYRVLERLPKEGLPARQSTVLRGF